MEKESTNFKWILIILLVISCLASSQSALASNKEFKSRRGNLAKRYFNNQHHYTQYRMNRQRVFRYRNNYYTRYRYNVHFGHTHGLIVSLPFNSRALFVRNHKYYHYHGVYYKKSACGYYTVPDPH